VFLKRENSAMSDITYSKQVVHAPWVGENFLSQNPRIFFLGESHYEVLADGSEVNFTTEMIQRQFGEGKDPGQEFERYVLPSKIERIFKNRDELTAQGSKAFWNEVAFYNFVQGFLESQKHRPSAGQFIESVDPFCEVICELQPDVVVVLGLGTWNHLPNDDRLQWRKQSLEQVVMSPAKKMKRNLELWCGSVKRDGQQHDFWCFFIPHPSAMGFGAASSWVEWARVAMDEISRRGKCIAVTGSP
jgi:hypothetical protein